MKRYILLTLLLTGLFTTLNAQTVLIDENFDGYSNGDWVAQTVGLPWSTWNNVQGGGFDTQLSNEQASSGTLSMRLNSTNIAGGPADMMLRLGNRNSGGYILTWNMYIPSGFGGYFNLQHYEVIGAGSWAMDATFRANGLIGMSSNATVTNMQYPQNQWFQVMLTLNFNAQQGAMYVNGSFVSSWSTTVNATNGMGINQVGGVNFFAYAGGTDMTRYYVDDVLFVEDLTVGVPTVEGPALAIHPNPATDVIRITTSAAPGALLSLLDATGRVMVTERQGIRGDAGVTMDIGHLPAGLYFLRLLGDRGEQVHRVVKH